jgi:hypothetical protein
MYSAFKHTLNGVKHRISFKVPSRNAVLHHVEHGMHSVYFGAVALEGHGLYATAGGILFVLVILNYFFHYDAGM